LQQKNHAVTLSHSFPLPGGIGRRSRRKKAKLVGCDENSLTEWQRKKKTTINNTDKKHIQLAVFSPPNAQLAVPSKKHPPSASSPLKY